jgi:hypothetical protein
MRLQQIELGSAETDISQSERASQLTTKLEEGLNPTREIRAGQNSSFSM